MIFIVGHYIQHNGKENEMTAQEMEKLLDEVFEKVFGEKW